jgi:oligopeptide/dipeptide ABC transporter ATP-binding protein
VIPIADPAARRERPAIRGEIPSPLNPPSGCHFRTRCPYAAEICADKRPPLEDDGAFRATACHFWRTLPAEVASLDEAEPDPRLERLFAAFEDDGRRAPAMTGLSPSTQQNEVSR